MSQLLCNNVHWQEEALKPGVTQCFGSELVQFVFAMLLNSIILRL